MIKLKLFILPVFELVGRGQTEPATQRWGEVRQGEELSDLFALLYLLKCAKLYLRRFPGTFG